MNKHILIILLLFLLIATTLSSVSALTFRGVQCSENAADYLYYNTTPLRESFDAALSKKYSIGITIPSYQDTIIMYFTNINWSVNNNLITFSAYSDGRLQRLTTGGWGIEQWTDDTHNYKIVASNENTRFNATITMNFFSGLWNASVETETSSQVFQENNTVMTEANEDWSQFEIYSSEADTIYVGERYIWNATKYGDSCPTFAPSPSSALNISSSNPQANHSFNILTVNFNVTANATAAFSCSLKINSTINQTVNNFGTGVNRIVGLNGTFPSGQNKYNYTINCSSGVYHKNTTGVDFYIDTTNPSITWTRPATTNSSLVVVDSNHTLVTSILMSDPNLYLYYLNITIVGNNSIRYNFSNGSLKGETDITLEQRLNFSTLSEEMLATLYVCDGHTANDITMSPPTVTDNKLDFKGILIYPENINDVPSSTKLSDRYTFNFNSPLTETVKRFVVKSPSYIDIIDDKMGYKGHLVLPQENKWIDFENSFVSSAKITRVSSNEVIVEVTAKSPTNKWTFNSIGELNCVTQYKRFFVVNSSKAYNSEVGVYEKTNFVLNLTYNKSYTLTMNASLVYNNTIYNTNATNYSRFILFTTEVPIPYIGAGVYNTSKLFYWNYTINGVSYNTTTSNQTIYKSSVDNCTLNKKYAINFTLKDENETAETGLLDIFYTWYIGTELNNATYSFSGGSTYSLCVYPSTGNTTINAQMIYSLPGMANRTYYLTDYFIDSNTDLINLYSTSGTTLVQFRVTDLNDIPIPEAYVKILTYDLGTDSYITSEIIKTDEEGYAYGNIILNTQFYKFIVEYNGEEKLFTSEQKITSTTKRFRISLVDNIFSNYNTLYGIHHYNLTFDNDTKTFSFTFNVIDGGNENVCLKVVRMRTRGDLLLYEHCELTSAATLSYIITETVDSNTYLGTAYIIVDSTYYTIDTKSHSYERGFVTYGREGIFLTAFIGIALVSIMVWSPVAAIVGLLVTISFSIILGIFFLNWTTLVVIIVLGGIVVYKLKN